MIQAPLTKITELPKDRPAKVERSESQSNLKPFKSSVTKGAAFPQKKEVQKTKDSKDFNSELNAALGKVEPVKVSSDLEMELPSTLVQPSSNSETLSPKVFDPALTKNVEKLIAPETTDVSPTTNSELMDLQLENLNQPLKGDFSQQTIKNLSSQVQSEMIDLSKEKLEPQLLSNEDFLAHKNLASKRTLSNHAYGMKTQPADPKVAAELELKQSQVIKEATASESPMNSQQFILGLQAEKSLSQTSETHSANKVFDMSQIKTSDTNEVMNQITDYVVQARTAKEPVVNLRVTHEDLGLIDITVSKAGHETIAINIGTHSMDGKNFFQDNSKDLMTHLTNAGLSVSDLKVETPTQTAKSDFDFGSQGGKNQQGSEKQFGSEQNQRRQESERRQDLWKLLNQEAA